MALCNVVQVMQVFNDTGHGVSFSDPSTGNLLTSEIKLDTLDYIHNLATDLNESLGDHPRGFSSPIWLCTAYCIFWFFAFVTWSTVHTTNSLWQGYFNYSSQLSQWVAISRSDGVMIFKKQFNNLPIIIVQLVWTTEIAKNCLKIP